MSQTPEPTPEGQEQAAELLARLWTEGAGIDDRDEIERISLVCDGAAHVDLRTILAWVDAMDGQHLGAPRSVERRDLAAIAAASRLRVGINVGDIDEIDRWLEVLGRDRIDAFAPVPRGMVQLAIIDAGLFARNVDAVDNTAFELGAAGQPIALRIQAARRSASIALGRGDFVSGSAHAHEVVTLAKAAGRPREEQIGRALAAICTTLAGGKAKPTGDIMVDVSIAMLEPAPRALTRLTTLMQQAGARGDGLGYMLCALIGARRYVELGRKVDAWLTVTSALVLLRERDPLYADPLEEERQAWLAAWGQAEYDRVSQDGAAIARRMREANTKAPAGG